MDLSEGGWAMTIDWIPEALRGETRVPQAVAALRGSLGLSAAPGRWSRDVDADLRALRNAGTTLLVSLLPDDELERNGLVRPEGVYFLTAASVGLEVRRFPITDFGVPRSIDDTLDLILEVLRRVEAGERVVVHCGAGLGRTGLVAACCLVELGVPAPRAIELVRFARPGAIETKAQEHFVRRFETDRP